jgi:hypothetical protein
MATLSHPAAVFPACNAPGVVRPCAGCTRPVIVPAGYSEPVSCQRCARRSARPVGRVRRFTPRHNAALALAGKLLGDVRDLREGLGVYSVLTADERAEQLAALGLSTPSGSKFPGFLTLPDDTLIALVCSADDCEALPLAPTQTRYDVLHAAAAELSRRLGSWKSTDAPAAPKFPGFSSMNADDLIELVSAVEAGKSIVLRPGESREDVWQEASAELARRVSTGEPVGEERAEIEDRLATMDAEPFDGLG